MADFPKEGEPLEAEDYNNLLLINEANEVLQDTRPGEGPLFSILASHFIEKDPSKYYTLFLVHRHYTLDAGERMVASGRITQPEPGTEDDPRVIPSSWTLSGRPYEWTRLTDERPHIHDSAYLQELLNAIASAIPSSARGNDLKQVLGVSLAQSEALEPDDVWWEELKDKERQHILTTRPRDKVPDSAIKTSWIPKQVQPGSMEYMLACCGVCHHCD